MNMKRIQVHITGAVLGCLLYAAAFAVLAQSPQRSFASPEDAAKALVAAAAADDDAALVAIFGDRHRDVIDTPDKIQARESRARFARAAGAYQLLRREADGRVTLLVGTEAWPLPIPLVQSGGAWRFDTVAGAEEIVNRRIGANELAVIEVINYYPGAQMRYASEPRDGGNVRQFAQRLASSAGKKDGLYWPADDAKGEEPSPFGPLITDASERSGGEPYHGYYFKVLKGQGPAAPGGRYSYVVNGRMVAGYALVAYPARYDVTGVTTFIVNHYGVVYQKDLGPKTVELARAMKEYNPDKSWQPVPD
jgi:Protein of unknown function (DUF2950)